MRRVWTSLVTLALAVGLTPDARSQIQLASRGPKFLSAKTVAGERMDARGAAVLRRRVAVTLTGVTVEAALKEIARQADLELIFTRTILPPERTVTLHATDITVAGALTVALLDTGLDVLLLPGGQMGIVPRVESAGEPAQHGAVAGRVTDGKTRAPLAGATVLVEGTSRSATSGNDGRYRIAELAPGTYTLRARYIGYAPATASTTVSEGQEATADFALEKSVQRLDEVVTTGTVVPTEVKALPTPISVITARDIQQQNLQQVDQVFRGQVPGAIAPDLGPFGLQSVVYVRGASTLSVSPSIKTFIDGVEMADAQFTTTIDPNSIDRIEITRGPQASTVYGAGAINGVMQIFTKRGQPGLGRPEITAKFSAGGISGFDGQSTAFQTDNAASILGGADQTSYYLGGSYRHVGDWAPYYPATNWGLSAGGRTTQGPLTLSGSVRYTDRRFGDAWDTRFQAYTPLSQPPYTTERSRQQTYGATATWQATRSWQHTLTLGYDQLYGSSLPSQPQFTTPADSFLTLYGYHEAKTSLLYHTDLSLRFGSGLAATVTGGVNYDDYDFLLSYTGGATRTAGVLDGSTSVSRTPWTSTGYFGQMQLSLAERLFVTGGLRAERNANFGADLGTAWSPRVGVAYAVGLGLATLKFRGSYGESIRAPAPIQREAQHLVSSEQLANPFLGPERQRGADGGVDLYLGRASLSVTYYTQRASDLIANVLVPTASGTLPTYQYQNVSRVKNDGWEFEGHLPVGPIQLAATYSITNSTIQALPPDYPAGGYQVGDPILGIPHTSAGATLTYSPLPGTTLTAGMTHLGHYTYSDYVALYGYYFGGQPYRGSSRAYWIEYPTVTKFAVGVSQLLTNGLTAFARAENLTNNLRFEQSNGGIPTPRSVFIGANVRY